MKYYKPPVQEKFYTTNNPISSFYFLCIVYGLLCIINFILIKKKNLTHLGTRIINHNVMLKSFERAKT